MKPRIQLGSRGWIRIFTRPGWAGTSSQPQLSSQPHHRPPAAHGPRGLPHRSLSEVVASRDATTSGWQRGRYSNTRRRATRRFLPGKEQHQKAAPDAPVAGADHHPGTWPDPGTGPESSNRPSREMCTQPDLRYPGGESAHSPGRYHAPNSGGEVRPPAAAILPGARRAASCRDPPGGGASALPGVRRYRRRTGDRPCPRGDAGDVP